MPRKSRATTSSRACSRASRARERVVRFFRRRTGESLGTGGGAGAAAVLPERARSAASVQARHELEAALPDERRAGDPRTRIPADVLRQIRHIDMRTRGLVNSLFAGEYKSVFKGQGME